MNQPSGGFNQSGLAELFHVPYDGGPVHSPTPSPKPTDPGNSNFTTSLGSGSGRRTASIVGGVVGGIAFVTLIATFGFFYRKQIHSFLTGGEWPIQEMDGEHKMHNEIMTGDIIWELPGEEKPIELWSPDDRVVKSPRFTLGSQGIRPPVSSPTFRDSKPPILSPLVRDSKRLSLSPVELDARPPSFKSIIASTKTQVPSPAKADTKTPFANAAQADSKASFPNPAKSDTRPSLLISVSEYTKAPSMSPLKEDSKPLLSRSITIRRPKPLCLSPPDKPLPKLP